MNGTQQKITIEKSYREIDALVAEHVFGWIKEKKLGIDYLYFQPGFSLGACSYWEPVIWNKLAVAEWLPHYSTQIEDSWRIIKSFEKESRFHLSGFYDGVYRAKFGVPIDVSGEAETIEAAICLAALKAKGVSLFFGEGVVLENPLT